MTEKTIFLSHIHEEKELALLIKCALEDEFSGFVRVFVSSDDKSNPSGTNFLNRIEDSLVSCLSALYLISPVSVGRSWINFELGAVWIRNFISLQNDGPPIPAIPVCHSGMSCGGLPKPISDLNAIAANDPAGLESAFKSIQTAVGGSGNLKTDFHAISLKVFRFEKNYTLNSWVKKIFDVLVTDTADLLEHCKKAPDEYMTIDYKIVETEKIAQVKKMAENVPIGEIVFDIGMAYENIEAGCSGRPVKMKLRREVIIDVLND